MRDFYEVLGVSRTAEHETIRRAYRRLARKYHPDLNPAAADQFKEVSAAYDVLGDPARRELYDEFGDVCLKPGFDPVVARYAGLGRGAGRSGGGGGGGGDGAAGAPRQDAFNAFFAGLNSGAASPDSTTAGTTPYRGSDPGPEPEPAPRNGSSSGGGFGGFPGFGGGSTSGTTPYQGSAGERYDASKDNFSSTVGTTPYRGSAGERYDPAQDNFSSTVGTTPYRGSASEAGTRPTRKGRADTYHPGKQYGDGGRSASWPPPSTSSQPKRREPDPYQQRMTAARQGSTPRPQQRPDPSPYARTRDRSQFTAGGPMPVPGEDILVEVEISLLESLQGTARELMLERTARDGRRQAEGLRVSIKAGVVNGEQIRLRGRGHQGRYGGPAGDLLLTVTVQTSANLRREGYDLYLDVPITLREALLGARIEVPTPDGTVRVKVPANSMSGRRLRLRRRGVSVGNGERGDMYLILRPTPPASSDPEVRRLVEALEQYYPREGVRKDLEL